MVELTTGPHTYWLVFSLLVAAGLGLPLPEEIPVVAAGAMAGHAAVLHPAGHPWWFVMLPVCIAGVVLGDAFLYAVGRIGGQRLIRTRWVERYLLPPDKRARIEDNFHKYGLRILLGARLLPGVRSPIFIMAGVLRMPLARFALADGLYAIPGVTLLFALAFWFTDSFYALVVAVERQVGAVARPVLVLLAVAAVGTWLGLRFLRHKIATGEPVEDVLVEAVREEFGEE